MVVHHGPLRRIKPPCRPASSSAVTVPTGLSDVLAHPRIAKPWHAVLASAPYRMAADPDGGG